MIVFGLILLALLKIGSCNDCECNDAAAVKEFAEGNYEFTADMYKQLILTEKDNIIVSPLSVEIVGALTTDGSCCNTEEQLTSAFHLPSKETTRRAICSLNLTKSTDLVQVLSANKLYVAKNFKIKPEFKQVAVEYYKSDVESVNFTQNVATAKKINTWVEQRTNNKIQNLILPNMLDATTRLVLVNALYFKGNWTHPFLYRNTRKQAFYTGKSVKSIEMMHTDRNDLSLYCFSYSAKLKAKFLELTYKDASITTTFILPDAKDGLADVEKNIEEYLKPQQCRNQRVAITLPKFTITNTIDFKKILEKLGVTDAFDEKSNLCDISDEKLLISFIVQKAFVGVNEYGTEAAAATAVGLEPTSVSEPPKVNFTADHPFIFVIRDRKTDIVLFIGRFKQ